ncbi:hypothetical protein U8527_02670 [Kordia algicida OT-1]|uniref:hypothetical protein n=1 Tax=Kordia algicida TaxID=221066 RepID=UPI003D9BFA3E
MKNLIITIISIFLVQLIHAQEPPLPPTPPSTSSSSSSSSTYSSSSNNSNEKTSISISYTEDDYKLRARFPKNRYEKLKNLIENTLGGKNMDIGKGYSKWSNDEKVYDIKLTKKNLRISLDLNVASPDLIEKFKNLGEDAKIIISGSSVNIERERVQREADRIRVEAERMKREAARLERQYERQAARAEERAKREIERAKRMEARKKDQLKLEAKRIERDAKRVELEAKRLEREAKRIEEKARHKGGVSSYIKRLLDDPKTVYTTTPSGANLNWIWPEVQENLLTSLLKDKLITSTSEVTFTNEKDRMYANGNRIDRSTKT